MRIGNRTDATLALLLLAVLGCSEATNPPPPTFAVTGVVRDADGQPLPSGIIQFIATSDPSRNMSSMIQEDGTFEIKSMHGNDNLSGAVEGECSVLVTLPIVGGQVPQTIKLPQSLEVAAQDNYFEIDLPRHER